MIIKKAKIEATEENFPIQLYRESQKLKQNKIWQRIEVAMCVDLRRRSELVCSSVSQINSGRVEWVVIHGHLFNPPGAKIYYKLETQDNNEVRDKKN